MNVKYIAETIISGSEVSNAEAEVLAIDYLSQEKKIEGLVEALERLREMSLIHCRQVPIMDRVGRIAGKALTAYKEGKKRGEDMSAPTGFLDRCKWELEKFEKLSFKSAAQLLAKATELEQQLADAREMLDDTNEALATEVNAREAAETKLTERDKLLDECLEIFVSHGYGSYPIAAKLQERER